MHNEKIKCDVGRGHTYWLRNFIGIHFFTFFSMLDFDRAESQLQSLEQSKVSLLCIAVINMGMVV